MIKPCTIRDLSTLCEIFFQYYQKDCTLWLRERVRSSEHKIFLFQNTMAISYEMIGTFKYCIHLIGVCEDLKSLKDFVIKTGSWMMDSTKCTCILAFADIENKRLQRFIGLTGGKRIGILTNANGCSDEILYSYSFKDKLELEGRLKCHKPYQQ